MDNDFLIPLLVTTVVAMTIGAIYLLTLLMSDGKKMGKTAGGAWWLDPELLSPYHYFQHWLNVADADVEKLLKLYSYLPLDEIARLTYVRTKLDNKLAPAVVSGNFRLVIVTGNAGDGKTAFLQQVEAEVQRWPTGAPYCFPGRGKLQSTLTRPRGRVFLAGDYLGTLYTETAIQTGFTAAGNAIERLAADAQH